MQVSARFNEIRFWQQPGHLSKSFPVMVELDMSSSVMLCRELIAVTSPKICVELRWHFLSWRMLLKASMSPVTSVELR